MTTSASQRWIILPLLFSGLTAHAIPPPARAPKQLREAQMTITVQLVEASHGQVNQLTKLCTVSGKIPVYADDGSATRTNGREIPGCTMQWRGENLNVIVRGAVAIAHGPVTFAVAVVGVVPPDAKPICPDVCGPQPLADSEGEVTVSGVPHSLKFSLNPNPVSMLNAAPSSGWKPMSRLKID